VDRAPELAAIGNKEVNENESLSFIISATDPDGDDVTYSAIGLPDGAILGATTGEFSWTPEFGDAKNYDIEFIATANGLNDSEAITITVSKISDSTDSPAPPSGGGGGGGGSPGGTGEEFENIDSKDYVLKSVLKDTETVFTFYGKNNSIVSVSLTSIINSGQVKSVVEILKDTSSQVKSGAPGQVFKNMNILLDDKKLNTATISNAKVEFKVEKKWLDDNEIDVSTITLCRYYGSTWEQLATEIKDEDDSYLYFISTTPGFSPFAISSIKPMTTGPYIAENLAFSSTDNEHTAMSSSTPGSDPIKPTTEAPQEKRSVLSFLLVIGLVAIMVLGAFGYRNKDYYDKLRKQLGNPDGKRYRRIK
ncbi:MAG: PGF-pre-PGF domain-containing protein, partial [Methanolobus sp.]|nr:PGF-pre-PGF domain-containing protein [Methanolobus sp.]